MWVEPFALSLSTSLLYSEESTACSGLFALLVLRAPKSTAAARGMWRGVVSVWKAVIDDESADEEEPQPQAGLDLYLYKHTFIY